MTRSLRINRRKAAALGIAFASISALALTTSAQAAVGPDVQGAGDIRVLPAAVGSNNLSTASTVGIAADGLNQPVPAINLGGVNQVGASAQIRIHNEWRSGDRVLLQVRDALGQNCASAAKSIGYSAAPTVVSSDQHYVFAGNSPMALNPPSSAPDVPVASTTPGIKPTFNVRLLSSTQCAPNGVNDLVEIVFTNESAVPTIGTAVATDTWVLTVGKVGSTGTATPISYNVGTEVAPGAIRNIPLAQNATASAGVFINTANYFGGNRAATDVLPLVQNLWTSTAFVLPVSLTATTPSMLVADGFNQNLGTITLKESAPAGLVTGTYRICYTPSIGSISLPVTATGPTVTNVINTNEVGVPGGRCIQFNLVGTAGIDTVVLSNIFAPVNSAGAVTARLVFVPPLFGTTYLTASDNPFALGPPPLSTSVNSDVDALPSPFITSPVGVAEALPDRIGGADRFETAAKIAVSLGCGDTAVIVNGTAFPDALSATYLAGALEQFYGPNVPILLSQTNTLPQSTVLALRENGVRSVFIVGGTNVISQAIEDQLSNSRRYYCGGDAVDNTQNIVVNRIGGATRYDTNNQLIERVQSIFAGTFNNRLRYQAFAAEPSKRTALVATGENFADALIGGQFAYEKFPLILTTGGTLSPQALQSMKSVDIEQVILLGGVNAVSAAVENAIKATGVTVIRLAGADRYETGVAVNNWALAGTFPGTPAVVAAALPYDLGLGQVVNAPNGQVFVARGDDFADALASAPLVSDRTGLLTLSDRTALSPATAAWLTSVKPLFSQATALGLGSAISTSVLDAANAAIN